MKIGINQFSYHRFFGEFTRWETDSGVRWTVSQFLDRAAALQVDTVSLQIPYLASCPVAALKAELDSRHLDFILEWGHPDGLKMGVSSEAVHDLRHWMRATSRLGGRVLRIVAGCQTYRGREPVAVQMARLVLLLQDLCQEAADLGLILALENHADFTPGELVELIMRVNMPQLRAAFDTGNCVRLSADLIESTEQIAPFTEIVHLKDLFVLEESRGDPNSSWPSAPFGKGSFDLIATLRTLACGRFDGPLLIEMSHMHPNWSDEDNAVEKSVQWLRANLPVIAKKATKHE